MDKQKLLEQLALAKEAGTKAMAKDFFHPAPGSTPAEGSPDEEASESPAEASAEGDMPPGADGTPPPGGAGDSLTPEQLEELLRMLGGDAGGGAQ